MGGAAAQLLLKKLANEPIPECVQVEPELIIRESTAPARELPKPKKGRTA
jgi:LacI family transcriptional regulator